MGPRAPFKFLKDKDFAYAVNLVETVTWLAGKPDYLDDLAETVQTLDLFGPSAGRARSAKVFEWLAATMSLQGISDQVAQSYMSDHGGRVGPASPAASKPATALCSKAIGIFTAAIIERQHIAAPYPGLIDTCPLPGHQFRNGNLNQLAYSLFLFIRDVAGGDLVSWIDGRLAEADDGLASDRVAQMADAIIGPLSGVHGVAGKVLSMVLSDLLVVGNEHNPRWGQVGGSLIAIDTLVHNFLVRTGILKRANAVHPYGPQCYGPTGCAAVLSGLSEAIDARQFNSAFPRVFPTVCPKGDLGLLRGRRPTTFATGGPSKMAAAAKIWTAVCILRAISRVGSKKISDFIRDALWTHSTRN